MDEKSLGDFITYQIAMQQLHITSYSQQVLAAGVFVKGLRVEKCYL